MNYLLPRRYGRRSGPGSLSDYRASRQATPNLLTHTNPPRLNAQLYRSRASQQPSTVTKARILSPASRSTELGQYILLVEVEELSLVRPDLLNVDLVIAGVHVLSDHLPVRLGVRPAGGNLRNHLLCDEPGGLLEVGWSP